MKHITIVAALFIAASTWGQTPWQFKAKVDPGKTGFLLEGSIGNKYPITMYLEFDRLCHQSGDNKWNYTYRLKGWYYYNDRKIKLPLIGYDKNFEVDNDSREKIALYVPVNILDEIDEKTNCELESYKEIFIAENSEQSGFISFQNMRWKLDGKKSFLPVKLKEIQRPDTETKVTITLEVRNMEMFSFNLTDNLSDLKDAYDQPYNRHIDNIEILASKAAGNDFYLIFSFAHPSVLGSIGFGHCGAGVEEYLGFLHISSLEVKEFKYCLTESCYAYFDLESRCTYDANFPEKGIQKNSAESDY